MENSFGATSFPQALTPPEVKGVPLRKVVVRVLDSENE